MRPRYGPWPPMNMPNGMRPPMRGRGGPGGPPCPPMRGMGPRSHRPPPYPGMGPPMRHYGPPPMGGPPRGGPHNRGHNGQMMPRMRQPPPHMMRQPRHMRPNTPMNKKLHKVSNNEGKIKKKKLKFRSFYVTRPWVNEELRGEITKKDKLFDQAKSSNKAEDWTAFKEQKDKCVHMYSALKLEYIGQHPEEVYSADDDSNESDDDNEEQSSYLCESCDRDFYDEDSHKKHMQEHQTCGIDGCKFNAHELLVMAHIKMQHSSGLYDKIRNISTPEDITKWREERKKNYPSKSNIELRYKQQEEMLKRGERIGPNKDRFGRTKNPQLEKKEKLKQQRLNKLAKKRKRKPVVTKTTNESVSLIDEKSDWNGTMFPFKGTKCLQDEDSDEEESKVEFSDDEWDQNEVENTEEPVLHNALGALMGAYQSDSDDEETKVVLNNKTKLKNIKPNVPDCSNPDLNSKHSSKPINHDLELNSNHNLNVLQNNLEISDVTEVKTLKVPVDIPDKATEMSLTKNDRKRAVPTENNSPIPQKKVKRTKVVPPPKVRLPRRPTLLQKLLDGEIRHERNVILQCVRYVVNNNFFDKKTNLSLVMNINNTTDEENVSHNTSMKPQNDNVHIEASTSKS